jgi:hypothetical protein
MPYDDIIMAQLFGMVTSERCMPSYQGSSTKSGSKHGQEYDRRIKIKIAKNLFNQDTSVAMARNCTLCNKPRFIITIEKGEQWENDIVAIERYIENAFPRQCGMTLFALDAEVYPFV